MFSKLTGWFTDPLATLQSTLMMLPAVIIGLTFHEWAHAFVAHLCGDDTARDLGRLTLNPIAHIDLVGFLSLLFLGFGWATPVPVNSRRFKHFKRDDIFVALAGITANLVLAFVFSIVPFLLAIAFPSLLQLENFWTVFQYIVVINLSLMVFNLIPLFPLDGAHVLEALLMRKIPKFCFFLRQYGRYIMLALLITGLIGKLLSPVVNFLFNRLWYIGYSILLSRYM